MFFSLSDILWEKSSRSPLISGVNPIKQILSEKGKLCLEFFDIDITKMQLII